MSHGHACNRTSYFLKTTSLDKCNQASMLFFVAVINCIAVTVFGSVLKLIVLSDFLKDQRNCFWDFCVVLDSSQMGRFLPFIMMVPISLVVAKAKWKNRGCLMVYIFKGFLNISIFLQKIENRFFLATYLFCNISVVLTYTQINFLIYFWELQLFIKWKNFSKFLLP